MWRRVFAVVFALSVLVCGALAPSAVAKVHVSVRPAIGKPWTRFVIGFRAPSATGNFSTVRSHYQVSAAGRKGKRCASSASIAMGPTLRGQRVRMTLAPRGSRRVWCAGRFRGTITKISKIVCRPLAQIVCPAIEIAPIRIAHFSFRVRRATRGSSGSPSSGPSFAGLQSATMCTPLPRPVAQPRLLPSILPVQRAIQLAWIPGDRSRHAELGDRLRHLLLTNLRRRELFEPQLDHRSGGDGLHRLSHRYRPGLLRCARA